MCRRRGFELPGDEEEFNIEPSSTRLLAHPRVVPGISPDRHRGGEWASLAARPKCAETLVTQRFFAPCHTNATRHQTLGSEVAALEPALGEERCSRGAGRAPQPLGGRARARPPLLQATRAQATQRHC